jgi:hypothetical protein
MVAVNECRPEPTSNATLPSGNETSAVVFGGTEMVSAKSVSSSVHVTSAVP